MGYKVGSEPDIAPRTGLAGPRPGDSMRISGFTVLLQLEAGRFELGHDLLSREKVVKVRIELIAQLNELAVKQPSYQVRHTRDHLHSSFAARSAAERDQEG